MDRGGDPDRAGRVGARPGAGTRIAAVCLIVALAVSGCSGAGDAEPSAPSTNGSPDASAAPSPTPGPTPDLTVPPQRPAAMGAVTVEGAVAAAEYFLALYPYVYNTGDLTEWKTLSHPECIFCASVISNVETMVADGSHVEGGAIDVLSGTAEEIDPMRWYSAVLEISEAPSAVHHGSPDDPPEPSIGGAHTAHVAVLNEAGRWTIRAVQIDGPE